MITININKLHNLLHAKGNTINPLVTMPPISLSSLHQHSPSGSMQELPANFAPILDILASASLLCQMVISEAGQGAQTYALYSTPDSRSAGMWLGEISDVAFYSEYEIRQLIYSRFKMEPSAGTKTVFENILSLDEAFVLAVLIDLQLKESEYPLNGGGFSTNRILSSARSFEGTARGLPVGGLNPGQGNFRENTFTSFVFSLTWRCPASDAQIQESLAKLASSGLLISSGTGWDLSPTIKSFIGNFSRFNQIAALNKSYENDGLIETEDVLLAVNAGQVLLAAQPSAGDWVKLAGYSALSMKPFIDNFFTRPVFKKIVPQQENSPRAGASISNAQKKRSSMTFPLIALTISLVVMLCGCGLLAAGLFG